MEEGLYMLCGKEVNVYSIEQCPVFPNHHTIRFEYEDEYGILWTSSVYEVKSDTEREFKQIEERA